MNIDKECREQKPPRINALNIIHIAGSKGKGSTCSMTASILSQFISATGSATPPRKIGVFASPHVRTIRERIQLISAPVTKQSDWLITREKFTRYFFDLWNALTEPVANRSLPEWPNFFVCLFAVAMHAFATEGVDAAIVECGLVGEYDATNCIDRPVISAITTLELEHVDVLSASLSSIA